MQSVRIEDLPDGGMYEPDDRFPIQRNESGVWNDYQTSFTRYYGDVIRVKFNWDGSGAMIETITCPVGKLLVMLMADVVFTPGPAPTSGLIQMTILQGGNSNSAIAELYDTALGQGSLFYLNSETSADPWRDLDQDIQISTPGGGFSGSSVVSVIYALIDPI